ncbi:MAG: hypothetical protein M3Y86_02655 [Verrucomicrobiota bacterium]|nr:hypothetical protein [Verrucomicrobiota bacterium]
MEPIDWKHVATLSKHEQMRAWVENWKRIGPELEKAKRRELRSLTEAEGTQRALRVMEARVEPRWRDRERRVSSGLIEQQRLFMKSRRSGQ